MTVLEIILLICGAAIFALSFILPTKKQEASDDVRAMIEEEVKKKVTEEVEGLKKHVDSVVDESVEYAQEKTERSLERISNEKIMAVNEYSDTVLDEINKNHKEVMFLYDMLNDKHDSLVNAVSEASRIINETKETTLKANEAAVAVKESALVANEVANVVKLSTKEAAETVNTFRSLAPDTIVMPEFDISQVLKYSQNPVVNIPSNIVIEPVNVQEPVKAAEPVKEAEPVKAAEPVKEAEPVKAVEPAKTVEAVKAEEPATKAFEAAIDSTVATEEGMAATEESKAVEASAEEASAENVSAATASVVEAKQLKTTDNAGAGKVRTLKWAAYAMQQADATYENSSNNKASEGITTSLATSTEEERAVYQETILKLHDAGKTDVEIARSLDMGVGEVSLIIGLRSKV